MIQCIKCGGDMPKARLDLYGYKNCVNCSSVKPKMARMVTHGTGDHTWNDIEILDYDTAVKLAEQEALLRGSRFDLSDIDHEEHNTHSKNLKESFKKLEDFSDELVTHKDRRWEHYSDQEEI